MRQCPACRLPRPPFRVYLGSEAGIHLVVAVCAACTARHDRLPIHSRLKLLDGVCRTAARDSDRYLVATFPDAGAAAIAYGMLTETPENCRALAAALGWLQ